MHILCNWHSKRVFIVSFLWLELVKPFKEIPAVVFSALAICWLKMNFLPVFLPNISYIHIAGDGIKGKPPGVSEAISPNFLSSIFFTHEWIIFWNPIRFFPIHINSKHFTYKNLFILIIAPRYACSTTVAHS